MASNKESAAIHLISLARQGAVSPKNSIFKAFSLALIIKCFSTIRPNADFLWVYPVSSLLNCLTV